jgi:2-oxo-4-hydroxy-4-carboxy-5-ureidoimidazoline decarboxylase
MPITLAELNDMGRTAFVAAVGEVFEHAPWIAEAAHTGRPFTSVCGLHDVMPSVLLASCAEKRWLVFSTATRTLPGGIMRGR